MRSFFVFGGVFLGRCSEGAPPGSPSIETSYLSPRGNGSIRRPVERHFELNSEKRTVR